MNKTSVKKLVKDISRPIAETATIISVEIDRVSIQIGSSPNVIRNVNVMGSTNTLAPGMTVRIMWVDRRPVVVGGASSDVGTVSLSTTSTTTDLPIHTHLDNLGGGILASYMSTTAHSLFASHILGVNVPHDDHGYLSGLGDDDHGQYVHSTLGRTITASHDFSPVLTQAPFTLGVNARGQTVFGLKADQLNKSVTASSGLTGGGALTADLTIALGTPTTLTEATINDASGATHAHAVTASANPGMAASLLKTTAAGLLTLDSIAITNSAQLKGSTVARSIGPEASYSYDLGSLGYWWRKAFISEMAGAVMSEYTQAVAGGWITVCKDQGTLAVAAGSAATTMDFGKSMASYIGNIVLVRHLDSSGVNKVEFVSITSLNSGTVYNVSRDLAGLNVTDPAWAVGTPYAVLGTTNDGYIELDAFDSPRFSIFKKTGVAWNAQSEIVRLGDLTGHPVAGASDVGMFIGDASQYLKYSAGVLTIAGNGSGLTQINGGNIQTGTVTAAKLTVASLSAITATMGTLTVDGTLTVGAAGKLLAGTAGAARTELNVNGLAGYNSSNVLQTQIEASTGALMAGAGTVRLDANGMVVTNTGTTYLKGLQFWTNTGTSANYPWGALSWGGTAGNKQLSLSIVTGPSYWSELTLRQTSIGAVAESFAIAHPTYPGNGFVSFSVDGTVSASAIAVTSTTKVTNLNADILDGYHAGNGSGQIPLSNGVTNSNLVAQYLSGYPLGQGAGCVQYTDGNNILYTPGAKFFGSTNIGVALVSGTVNIANASVDNVINFNGNGANYDDVPAGYSPHWSSADGTKVYIRVAGTYQVSASCVWPINSTGTNRFMGIKVNTSWLCIDSRAPQTTTNMWQSMSFVWKFAAGDILTLILRQDSTAATLSVISALFYSIAFRIARIA